MSTYLAKPGEIKSEWHTVDATDQVLGRLAAKLAVILQGKHKPTYTAHVLSGDNVVVLNAEKIRVTGNKANDIEYDKYTRYAGGRKISQDLQLQADERRAPGASAPARGEAHASQEQARPRHAAQAQGVQRRVAPAHGSATQGAQDLIWLERELTHG
jgi:ribosomal protein L13